MADEMNVSRGRQMLSAHGLNLFSVLGLDMLPEAFDAAVRNGGITLEHFSRLIVIGHGGNLMWQRLNEDGVSGRDPVDEFSERCAVRLVKEYLNDCAFRILYPGDIQIPLQQLGSIAGWHHASPLGIGVNEIYGPWFGYRVVLLVAAEIPVSMRAVGPSPCTHCTDKPCIGACPGRALAVSRSPDVARCVDYRVRDRSPCASSCLARLACPAGVAHRYGDEQLHYYYGRSLDSIKAHLSHQGA